MHYGPLVRASLAALAVTAVGLSGVAPSPAQAGSERLTAAATELGVPADLLLAVSYLASRWDDHAGQPSRAGGYGPMHLVDGGADAPLQRAARLLGDSPAHLRSDAAQNLRGGAALLAEAAGNTPPSDLAGWHDALARTPGWSRPFADRAFSLLRSGVARTMPEGRTITLAPHPELPVAAPPLPQPGDAAECPAELGCQFVPAAYAGNNPADPRDYGNYDWANRPDDMAIDSIVIHDTELSYDATLATFANPRAKVSSHYVVRSSDGAVTQMVRTSDVAYQAGNSHRNIHSVGIEHEGMAESGGTWYTEAMYESSATLAAWLAQRFGFPADRDHIVGHDEVPGPLPDREAGMHWDPGPFWDWDHYLELVASGGHPVDRPVVPRRTLEVARQTSPLLTIAPDLAANVRTMQSQDGSHPITGPVNFVALHTEPRDDSPLVSQAAIHPDGSPGTDRINDWGARANAGQTFYRTGREGDWSAIWFDGAKAWFFDPDKAPASRPAGGVVVRPADGKDTVPIYGRAFPEAAAYPPEIPVQPLDPLRGTLKAGQDYVVLGSTDSDFYYAKTVDNSIPADHTVVRGADRYYLIRFNSRLAYVRTEDVTLRALPDPLGPIRSLLTLVP